MRKRLDALFSALMLLAAVAVVLAGGWCLAHSIDRTRTEPAPIPVAQVHIELPEPEPGPEPTPEPAEAEPLYVCRPDIPLSPELQQVLYESCAEADVPVALVLGLIEVESCFQADAVSERDCYGLMQLNPKYFPDKLSPADNLRKGIAYLGRLLEQYGDPAAALTAYHAGYDTGSRVYASVVMATAEWWEEVLE